MFGINKQQQQRDETLLCRLLIGFNLLLIGLFFILSK